MQTSLSKPFHKATIIPVSHPSWELRLEEPYRLTQSLTFEKVQGLLNPELFSVWRDWISQRDRDNLSSIRFALMHYFDSSGHMGREEADSKDYGFKAFLCLRLFALSSLRKRISSLSKFSLRTKSKGKSMFSASRTQPPFGQMCRIQNR